MIKMYPIRKYVVEYADASNIHQTALSSLISDFVKHEDTNYNSESDVITYGDTSLEVNGLYEFSKEALRELLQFAETHLKDDDYAQLVSVPEGSTPKEQIIQMIEDLIDLNPDDMITARIEII